MAGKSRKLSPLATRILRIVAERHPHPLPPAAIRDLAPREHILSALDVLLSRWLIRMDSPSRIAVSKRGLELLQMSAYR